MILKTVVKTRGGESVEYQAQEQEEGHLRTKCRVSEALFSFSIAWMFQPWQTVPSSKPFAGGGSLMSWRNFCLLHLLLTACLTSALNAAVTTDVKVPVNIPVFIPCAAGGTGELVVLQGDLHVLLRFTVSTSGNIHAAMHFQPQGISGVGQTTGDKYQGTGVTQTEVNLTVGTEETMVNNFRIIGQGNGNNFLLHETFHITINANGMVTAFLDNFSVDCR
jgi:hypothetical protein